MNRAELIKAHAHKNTTSPMQVIRTDLVDDWSRVTFVGANGWVSHKNFKTQELSGVEFNEVRPLAPIIPSEVENAAGDESQATQERDALTGGFSEGEGSPPTSPNPDQKGVAQ